MNRAYTDPSMELHRKINPDWRFNDTVSFLLAEIATIESDRRYFEAARVMDDVPEQYWPARYGPASLSEDSSDQTTRSELAIESADRARAVADEMRAGMFG